MMKPYAPFALAALSALGLLVSQTSLAAEGQAPQGLPAEVVKLDTQVLERSLEAVGSLRANESVVLRPEQTGRIERIHFEEGRPVKLGDRLFTLDASIYEAELAQAQARVELSTSEYQRAEQLLNKKLGAQHERDKALAQMKIDQAQEALARTRLQRMRISAPFSGLMGLRQVSIGDYVTSGQALVALVDLQEMKADFRIPEVYLPQVRVGQRVDLELAAFPGERFQGEVYAIAPKLDENGRSLEVRARIPNPDLRLRPGLFAKARLLIERKEAALMVPEQAIIPRGQAFFVYQVVDGQVAMLPVKLGLRRQGQVEVLEGLQPGDLVVTAGQLKLRPGAAITPLFPTAPADQPTGQQRQAQKTQETQPKTEGGA